MTHTYISIHFHNLFLSNLLIEINHAALLNNLLIIMLLKNHRLFYTLTNDYTRFMPHKTLNALDNECHVLFTFLKFPFKFEIETHI